MMFVLFEFFDTEPLENIVTCLHYKPDKVVYFGHSNIMTAEEMFQTKKNLADICGITNIRFVPVSQTKFNQMIDVMEQTIQQEVPVEANCFFDLTGGEDLILVAAGILASRYKIALHRYNVEANRLMHLNYHHIPDISGVISEENHQLTIEEFSSMAGGSINKSLQKTTKMGAVDEQELSDIYSMWTICEHNSKKWNYMSSILKLTDDYENSLVVDIAKTKINEFLVGYKNQISMSDFVAILKELADAGFLLQYSDKKGCISFHYKNALTKDCLWDAGCALERYVYANCINSGQYNECQMGVHIDWNDELKNVAMSVGNEIDVLCLDGNIPTFISCKNGNYDTRALYELQTVAEQFGGKYARKRLIVSKEPDDVFVLRAEEMGIEIYKP